MSTAAAVVLFVGVTAYAVFGGADFGAGFWDLTAGGTRRGNLAREVIDHSIGPVWEANHVWLIFSFVVLWTCFPEAYASITLTLFVPLTIAAVGIVFRGELRLPQGRVPHARPAHFGAAFAISSVIVPYCMGAVAGGSPRGGSRPGARPATWDSWVNPTSILGGVLAVCVVAYLAAVYLVWDAHRLGDEPMVEYFRRRAVGAAVASGIVAFAGIFVLAADADYVFDGLTSRALPLVILSAVCGVGTLWLLHRRQRRGARLGAIVAVASVVVAWGVAQWDYMLPESLTVKAAAAPSGTIAAVLVATGLAVVLILPAFGLLYTLDQRDALAEPES